MNFGSSTHREPLRWDVRMSVSSSSYQEITQDITSSAPARAEECRHSRSLFSLACRQIANSAMLLVGAAPGQSTLCAQIAAERRSTPRTRSGPIRERRDSSRSSMLKSAEMGPVLICSLRDFFTEVLAAGSDWGKCSVPARAIVRLD